MSVKDEEALLSALAPGASIFVQGGVGEAPAFIDALVRRPERAAGVRFTAPLIPGVNRFDYAAVHKEATLTAYMAAPCLAQSVRTGRARIVSASYAQTARLLSEMRFDAAVLQLTPPDASGLCSFGVSGDFGPLIWRKARRVIGVINPLMPRPPRSETVPFKALDAFVESAGPLRETPASRDDADGILNAVAKTAAGLVPDGAHLQTGIGGAPGAVLNHLSDRRGLKIRSGMIIEAHRKLHEAGALAKAGGHVAGIAYGDQDFYEWASKGDLFAFERVTRTHSVPILSRLPRFTAVNSALEVDLFGQANLEWRQGQAVSGVGGAPDFARAAALSQGGMSIIALPSRAGEASRITPRLTSPTVSLARHDVDVVVTEYGAAWLRDKCADERAEALTLIAHPSVRADLRASWLEMGRKGGARPD